MYKHTIYRLFINDTRLLNTTTFFVDMNLNTQLRDAHTDFIVEFCNDKLIRFMDSAKFLENDCVFVIDFEEKY